MAKAKTNLALEEAEIKKIEELNKRRKKALQEAAELLRQEKELKEAAEPELEEPAEVEPVREVTGNISDQFADVLKGLEEDGKFWVFKIEPSGRQAQCGSWPIADWPTRMEEIAHDAGGGTFRIQFKTASGQYVKQTTVTFDPKFYGGAKEKPAQTQDAMVALMMQQNAEARREAAEARRETGDLMKTILAALMAPKEGGFIKSAQDVAVIGEMFGKKSGPDGIEMLKLGMELAQGLKEEKEPVSTLDRLMEQLAPVAGPLLARLAAAPAAPRPAQPSLGAVPKPVEPQPLPAPEAPAPEAPKAVPADPVKSHPFYGMYVPRMLEAAKANESPAEWAGNVVDLFPAVYHGHLLEVLNKPDLVEFLALYEPEARNLAPWITSVRNEILELFKDDLETEGEIPAPPVPLKNYPKVDESALPSAVLKELQQ